MILLERLFNVVFLIFNDSKDWKDQAKKQLVVVETIDDTRFF